MPVDGVQQRVLRRRDHHRREYSKGLLPRWSSDGNRCCRQDEYQCLQDGFQPVDDSFCEQAQLIKPYTETPCCPAADPVTCVPGAPMCENDCTAQFICSEIRWACDEAALKETEPWVVCTAVVAIVGPLAGLAALCICGRPNTCCGGRARSGWGGGVGSGQADERKPTPPRLPRQPSTPRSPTSPKSQALPRLLDLKTPGNQWGADSKALDLRRHRGFDGQ